MTGGLTWAILTSPLWGAMLAPGYLIWFLLLFNGHYEETVFQLPPRDFGARWTAELDTDGQVPPGRALRARAKVTLAPRSCVLLTRPPEPAPQPDAASTSAPSRDSAR